MFSYKNEIEMFILVTEKEINSNLSALLYIVGFKLKYRDSLNGTTFGENKNLSIQKIVQFEDNFPDFCVKTVTFI